GYRVKVGAYTSVPQMKTWYKGAINQSGNRVVPDIDFNLSFQWLGGAELKATATVVNNSGSTYDGHVRVYITEKVSSLNWRDSSTKLYKCPMLDYAFDVDVSIANGDTWTSTMTWDGATHTSGNPTPQSYANIDYDNIALVGAVHNAEWHQGYSGTPPAKPFDAYYVDEAAMAEVDTLSCDVYTVSEMGGTVNLNLYAGSTQLFRNYLIIGGMSGSEPGETLPGGVVLPVNFDAFTDYIFFPLLNSAVFSSFLGQLGLDGTATAQLNVPALPAGYTGSVMTFAYCMNNPFNFASNAVNIEIVP
ncbi:MAG: hypothetical protein ABIK28_01785, partial [Planctomycetota bacterium]